MEELNLHDYIEVIIKRWYMVLFATLIMAFVVGIPSLSKKGIYEAKAALLLKNNVDTLSQLSNPQNLLGLKITSNGASFPILIKSRAVANQVLNDLNLTKRIKGWDAPGIQRQDLISSVQSMVTFSDKSGLFEVKAQSADPILSTDLANAFAKSGADIWDKLNYTEARKKREYIEGQIPRVDADLRKSENALKKFSLISPSIFSLSGVEFKRLQREYDIQDAIYTILRKEYENAKIEESKTIEPFSVIDPAEIPLKPLPPRIVLNFVIGSIMGVFLGIFLSLSLEYWEKTGKDRRGV